MTLKNQFVWDDGLFIQDSSFIKKWENVKVFFSPENYFKYTQDLTYRPLPFLVHIANYKIWGVNPLGHRLTNIFLHIAVAVLLYFLVLELFKNNLIALFSALFFAVHPANTEVVNMVSFVETQLSTVFFLASFFCYVVAAELRSADGSKANVLQLHIFSILCYFLAVFSKETAITLPAVIILYDYVVAPQGGAATKGFFNNLIIKKYLPFFIVALFYLIVRFFIFRHPMETTINYPGGSFITNIFVMLKAVPVYLSVIFLPFNLSVEHKIITPLTFFESPVVFGFFAVVIFVVILIYSYKKSLPAGCQAGLPAGQAGKPVFFWLMFIVITFLPTSNIIPMQNIIGERYLYLPIIGFCVISALFVEKLNFKYPVAVCILVFFSVTAVIRNCDWKDSFTFYSKVLKQNPESNAAHVNMSAIYAKRGDYGKALKLVNFAIGIDNYYESTGQNSYLAYFNRGCIYKEKKEYDKAIKDYNKALKLNPAYIRTLFNRGGIYYDIKQYDKALSDYSGVLKYDPINANVYYDRGNVYYSLGDYGKAVSDYNRALDIDTNYAEAYCNRGNAYLAGKEYAQAIKDFNSALKINPGYAKAYCNRGNVYYYLKEYDKAIKDYTRAIAINPDYALAYSNRAAVYYELKNYIKLKEDVKNLKELRYPVDSKYLKYLK